jgi:ketosteroid isomerase-like protein
MKNHQRVTLSIAIAMLYGIGGQAQTTTPQSRKITDQLLGYNADYITCMAKKDPELVEKYLATGIRLMPAFQRTLIGKQNARLYLRAFTSRFDVGDIKRTKIDLVDMGKQVLEIGHFSMTITVKSTGEKLTVNGNYLDLWEWQKDELLLITQAWNYSAYYGDFHKHFQFEEMPSVQIALLPNVPVNDNVSFELEAMKRLLDATVTQHDAKTWSLFYSDDAVLMPNYKAACIGKSAIDNYIAEHVKELPIFEELDIRSDRIDNLGNYVIEYSSHIASWKVGASSGVSLGKNIRIWRREADHSLKVFRSIAMYD